MVSVCLPSDALLQHLPSYLGFSCLGCGEFQRIARRDKKAFFSDPCKEIEENNRMGKTRDFFKKIRDTRENFHTKMGSIKNRNGMDLTEGEAYYSWVSQGQNTEVVCHSLVQWTKFFQTSPPWPTQLGWPPQGMAWFHWVKQGCGTSVTKLTSFLWLWFQCVCLLMLSCNTYHLTWVSLALGVGSSKE